MEQEASINRFNILYGREVRPAPSLAERKYHALGGVVSTMGQLSGIAYAQGRDGIRWEPNQAKRDHNIIPKSLGATHWSRKKEDSFGTSRRVHMEVGVDGQIEVSFSAMVEGKDENGEAVINAAMLPLRDYLSRPEVWIYLGKPVEKLLSSPAIDIARYAYEHAEPISDNVPSENPHI